MSTTPALEVLSIGSALVDIFVHSDEFLLESHDDKTWLCQQYGEKLEATSMVVRAGGGAANTATGLARLGLKAGLIAELGKDRLAEIVMSELAENKVNTALLLHERREETGGSVILIGKDGGRTVLVHRGAAAQLDVADIPSPVFKGLRWLHLSSIGGREATLTHIFTQVRASQVALSWNPGKGELQLLVEKGWKAFSPPIEVLFVNKQEWQMLESQHSQIKTAVGIIVVTDGSKGGQVWRREASAPTLFPAKGVKSVDDTGAGDAFATGFIGALLHERSLSEACRWGVTNAGSVVGSVGATPGLLPLKKLER
jgi:ribokinase